MFRIPVVRMFVFSSRTIWGLAGFPFCVLKRMVKGGGVSRSLFEKAQGLSQCTKTKIDIPRITTKGKIFTRTSKL